MLNRPRVLTIHVTKYRIQGSPRVMYGANNQSALFRKTQYLKHWELIVPIF